MVKGWKIEAETLNLAVNDYANYCKKTLKNGNTTANMSLKILRIFFNDAMKEELIPYAASPFEQEVCGLVMCCYYNGKAIVKKPKRLLKSFKNTETAYFQNRYKSVRNTQ